MTGQRCAYVYPGNHKRCGRDVDDHGVTEMRWGNITANGHAYVPPAKKEVCRCHALPMPHIHSSGDGQLIPV